MTGSPHDQKDKPPATWSRLRKRLGWVRLDEQFDTVEGLAIYDQS
jgi:hypothetical protein